MANPKPPKPKKPKIARWQRIAMMDKEILDVEGAATLLGVSTTTIYNLARKGDISATRVGREWHSPAQISFNGSPMAPQPISSAWR